MRIPSSFILSVAAICLELAGCALISPPASDSDGVSQIATNVFRVSIAGRIGNSQADANGMALVRSAEVARRNGYRFFISSGAAPTGSAVLIATNVVQVPGATMTITCFRERPDTTAVVHDVDTLLAPR